MKTKYYKYVLLLSILLGATSCVSKKEMVYFQDVEGMQLKETLLNFEPKIQAGDVLSINVSAQEAEASASFNLYETASPTNPKPLTHLVNSAGEINFPVLGTIQVKGFTTKELTEELTKKISEYIVKPIVNIRLTNFKITVMGEVKAPGTYPVPNERITIIEALGLAGDLNIQGKRNTVMLIREQEGERTFTNIDLTNKKLFNSPYYYLAQNDVLYVEPNKTKINSSAVGTNTSVIISSVSILITLLALLVR
jgi:polysaccharide export outer membrane protein